MSYQSDKQNSCITKKIKSTIIVSYTVILRVKILEKNIK